MRHTFAVWVAVDLEFCLLTYVNGHALVIDPDAPCPQLAEHRGHTGVAGADVLAE
jgi:hypothetical protein